MAQFVMTVTGKDRPGIIANVTELLYEAGANLEDVSMTILEGEFTMILIVGCGKKAGESAIRRRLPGLEKKTGLTMSLKKLGRRLVPGRKHRQGSRSYLLTAAGRDKTGIVYKISKVLARAHWNITDMNSKILPKGRNKLYVLMLEADASPGAPAEKMETQLKKLEKELEIEIRLKPVQVLEF